MLRLRVVSLWVHNGDMNPAVELQPFGGHVTSAVTTNGEIFWLSELSPLHGPDAIRGGVPVIAPRFATLMGGQKHGWARTARWEKTSPTSAHVENEGLELSIEAAVDGQTATLTFTATNTSAVTKKLQLGLHPYFLVGDVEQIRITGLDGADLYELTTDTHEHVTEPLSIAGEFDRIVTPTDLHSPISCTDPVMGRTLELTFTGHDHVVIWNPGKEHTLPDVPTDQWRHFICIEPALLGDDLQGVDLPPGGTHVLEMSISNATLL